MQSFRSLARVVSVCALVLLLMSWAAIRSSNRTINVQSEEEIANSGTPNLQRPTMDDSPIVGAIDSMVANDLLGRFGDEKVAQMVESATNSANSLVQLCFAPDTPEDVIAQFSVFGGPRFNQIARWSQTASGGTGSSGDRITLTYSFPPDGTTIPMISGVSYPAGINDFNDWMDGIYGNQAVWQPIFEQVFARWSLVAGITYVYEPNDDGVNTNINPGMLGVRGDLRICGKFLDGNSGVLAYNNFPDDGDMVFDTGDNFFNNTTNNSLRLRNVAAHEHGHGMGQLHVCPIQQIKLMEPFVSEAFDGPQHDDIRNAHGHYGDPFEPDNSIATATDLGLFSNPSSQTIGTLSNPTVNFGSRLSIDANGEQDYFEFSIDAPASLAVTVTPIGTNYDDSDQACGGAQGSCCSGSFTNSLAIANLDFQVIAGNGAGVLATGSSTGAGLVESLSGIILDSAGSYFIRVFESSNPSQPQLYLLNISVSDLPFLPVSIVLPNGAPTELVPGAPTVIDVNIDPRDEVLVGGSAQLRYRFDGGAFLSSPLVNIGGHSYEATLPEAGCDDAPEFFIEAEGTMSGVITFPTGGAASPLTAIVGMNAQVFDDNVETDMGWASTGDASEGLWERGIPVNNNRGDPPADFDDSGQCWLTENDPNDVNSDIDDGAAILTSPVIDLSSLSQASISYARWLDNTNGSSPSLDPMLVEVSDDNGNSWTTLEVVGPAGPQASGGWFQVNFDIGSFVSLTSQFRLRFTVADADPGSVVEAGLDAIQINGIECDDMMVVAPSAPNGVAATDGLSCDDVVVTWDAVATADDYDVFRNSINDPNTASMIATGVATTSFTDTTIASGASAFYWVQACNTAGCSPFSAEDFGSRLAAPNSVTGLSASDGTICGAIELQWDAEPTATQYRVFRNTSNDFGGAVEVATVIVPAVELTDVDVDDDASYFYWVIADNSCGASVESGPDEGSASTRGDFNLDGFVDGRDIDGMVAAFLGDGALLPCADLAAQTGVIDLDDVTAFVGLLLQP